MPRRARQFGESGYMHLIVRGIGRQLLFEDASDYRHYLKKLEFYCLDTEVKVCAFCLMDNHVHLLVKGDSESIVLLMKKIGVSYSGYFNKKYDRVGHLFQDRYRSEPIEDERYLLTAFRYVLQNPQKAGICNASEYRWSSYNLYDMPPAFMDLSLIWQLLGTSDQYKEFLAAENDEQCLDFEDPRRDDEWAKVEMKQCLGVTVGAAIQSYTRTERNRALRMLRNRGLSVRQIARLTGISKNSVLYACR